MAQGVELEITPEVLQKVESLAARGMIEKDIALCLGIRPGTLSDKKLEDSELSEAIKRGKAKGIARVTAALLKNVDSGNVTAQIFYLKTQAKWREADSENNNKSSVMEAIFEKLQQKPQE